jgi:hypothetical protein
VPPIVAAQNTALNPVGSNKVTLLTPSVQGSLQPVQLDVSTGQLSEKIVQSPPPPSTTNTYNNISPATQNFVSPQNTNVIISTAVSEIHASFNAGIMNLLAQSANSQLHQPQNIPQQSQQFPQQQQQYQHQPFQPYPGQPPQTNKK